jgi:hypothetical protein
MSANIFNNKKTYCRQFSLMTRFVDALKRAPFTSGNISGAYGAHIKSDPLILEPTLFTYITKNTSPTMA